MNDVYEKQVGKQLRALREQKKLTQEEVAAQLQLRGCDVTRSALAKIEVGQRHLYVDELKHLREILDVSFEEILLSTSPVPVPVPPKPKRKRKSPAPPQNA